MRREDMIEFFRGFYVETAHTKKLLTEQDVDDAAAEGGEVEEDAEEAADQEDAEALLNCCTDFNTFDAIEPLEQALGKPVISSNSATLCHCLRGAGISDPIYGLGKLLRYH